MKKKYKKDVTISYQYANTPESEQVLEQVFDKIFSHIIQRQKQLKEYFNSDAFKEDYTRLQKRKSILVDYLSIH
jgi:spore coat protein CotF